MRRRIVLLIGVCMLMFAAACAADEPKNADSEAKQPYKSEMVEKELQISYVDVYLDGGGFNAGNRNNGMVIIPFVYEESVFLPVEDFACDMLSRKTVWNEEERLIEIQEPQTYGPKNSSYRYPDTFPREIEVSYGGITLVKEGEEIVLDEQEQLLVYDGVVYAPAELLGRIFNKLVEWRSQEITASYGTFDYKYLFMGPPLASELEIQSDRKFGGLEANIKPEQFEPEPPAYLDIVIK